MVGSIFSEFMVTRVDEAVDEYSRQFEALMLMLRDQGERGGDTIRNLTFRLDFNEYYSSSASVIAASAPAATTFAKKTVSKVNESLDSFRSTSLSGSVVGGGRRASDSKPRAVSSSRLSSSSSSSSSGGGVSYSVDGRAVNRGSGRIPFDENDVKQ